ncbi:MAG: hypothetical protein EHM72_09445, partial [Calditrichaeota bacterium]
MNLEIKPVVHLRELKQFVKFPFDLYQGNEYWAPPLISGQLETLRQDRNPAFAYCRAAYWIASRDGKIVGRIAAMVNDKFNSVWSESLARFGWFDFVDDIQVSSLLLATAEKWAQEQGMSGINGPMGFTNFDASGMLVEGFKELSTFGAAYNHSYYASHLEHHGYGKAADWVEYQIAVPGEIPDKVERIAEIVEKRFKLELKQFKHKKQLLPFAHDIFSMINVAYKDIYGFVELSERQVEYYIHSYLNFIKPELTPLIFDEHGKLVAFGITMPSLSVAAQKAQGRLLPLGIYHFLKAMRSYRQIDFLLTAVHPDFQNKGVNAMLMLAMHKFFIEKGVESVETNWEHEDNLKIQAQWRFYQTRL